MRFYSARPALFGLKIRPNVCARTLPIHLYFTCPLLISGWRCLICFRSPSSCCWNTSGPSAGPTASILPLRWRRTCEQVRPSSPMPENLRPRARTPHQHHDLGLYCAFSASPALPHRSPAFCCTGMPRCRAPTSVPWRGVGEPAAILRKRARAHGACAPTAPETSACECTGGPNGRVLRRLSY